METEELPPKGTQPLTHPGREPRWITMEGHNSVLIRFLLLAASGWAMVQLLAYFQVLVVVFVSATILAFLLNHIASWWSRWLPRRLATGLVFLGWLGLSLGFSLTLGTVILSQGQQLAVSVQDFSSSLIPWLQNLETWLAIGRIPLNLQRLEPQLQNQLVSLLTSSLGLLQSTLTNVVLAFLIAVVTLFMMLDGDRIWWWLLGRLPIYHKERFNEVIQRNLLAFFWGLVLLSIFFGLCTFLVFWGLGVPYAAFLGLVVGLLDLIPGIGAMLGIGLVCLLLLSQSVWLALKALIVCITLQQVQENLLLPYVMKDSLDLNPVVMFFALIVGATVAGVLGLFLAVPVAGVIITWLDIEAMRGKPSQNVPTKN
ncbi:MAG: AI-2E family transporter [Nodosilinea sp.]